MTAPFDPGTLDLNLVIRDALHRRGTAQDVRPHLEAAVAAVVPAEDLTAAITDGIWRTVRRQVADIGHGGDDGDALHMVAANLGRCHFNFDWTGGAPGDALDDDSYVPLDGRLARLGDVPEPRRSEDRGRHAGTVPTPVTVTPPAASAARGGTGCLGLWLAGVALAAWTVVRL